MLYTLQLPTSTVFGFSFKGTPRAPFDAVLETLKQVKKPLAAVDIPSGRQFTSDQFMIWSQAGSHIGGYNVQLLHPPDAKLSNGIGIEGLGEL